MATLGNTNVSGTNTIGQHHILQEAFFDHKSSSLIYGLNISSRYSSTHMAIFNNSYHFWLKY